MNLNNIEINKSIRYIKLTKLPPSFDQLLCYSVISLCSSCSSIKAHQLPRLLLGISGSVAAVKVAELYNQLSIICNVRIVLTSSSKHFYRRSKYYNDVNWQLFVNNGGLDCIFFDEDEWTTWDKIGDPVLHIELRKWAHIILIAPASANLLAKLACGQANDLLSCILRATDMRIKPCLLCPAMNTLMWHHPSTAETLGKLSLWGYHIVNPVVKTLACKDVGIGALSPVADIVNQVSVMVERYSDQFIYDDDHVYDKLFTALISKRKSHSANISKDQSYIPYISILLMGQISGALLLYTWLRWRQR